MTRPTSDVAFPSSPGEPTRSRTPALREIPLGKAGEPGQPRPLPSLNRWAVHAANQLTVLPTKHSATGTMLQPVQVDVVNREKLVGRNNMMKCPAQKERCESKPQKER